jgi:hypothetical protein
MKKITLACFLLGFTISISYGTGEPCHVDCSSITQQAEQDAKQRIEDVYDQLEDELDKLKEAYTNYQKATDNQTELLEKVQTLKARNALLEKQILFLRTQDKELVGLSIDSTNTKKELKKP